MENCHIQEEPCDTNIWHYVAPPMERCDARVQHITVGHCNRGKFDNTVDNCPVTIQHFDVIFQHCDVTMSLCDVTIHHGGVTIQNFVIVQYCHDKNNIVIAQSSFIRET